MQMSNICVLLTLFLFSVTWRPLLGTDGIHADLQTTPVLWNLSCLHLNGVFCVAGELLSQPRPEGLTEIVCPKNGSERVNVALVYPPMPTMLSPSLKWPGNVDCGLLASPNLQGRFHFSVFFQAFFTWLHHAASNPRPLPPPLHLLLCNIADQLLTM